MKKTIDFQKIGGAIAILEALIYITAFIFYGAVLETPSENVGAIEKMNFLSDNQTTLFILNLMTYVLFGILLIVLVLAIEQRLKASSPLLSKISSLFGFIWAGLVIASGMIANINMSFVIELGAKDPEKALWINSVIGIITEGLGGGNEIIGGIWVFLLSLSALQGKIFPNTLIFLGIAVGIVGISTAIYPTEIATLIFGVSQIIWFFYLGIHLLGNKKLA